MNDHLRHKETWRLIAADKVQGTAVYDHAGAKMGSIENVMIDKASGKVTYAVMSFGGFLGMGEKRHPLPWSVLKYDTHKDGYVVPLDKRTLEKAPSFATAEPPNYDDEAWGRSVHDYYNVPWR